MAKRVRVSSDNGTTWYTLPGNTAELTSEAGDIDDTIFGQSYSSSQSGLIGWSLSANGLFKGFAGYVAKISKSGTSTVMTNEACSLSSGKTYIITATTKRVINPAVAVTVKDNNVTVASTNIRYIDYLFGTVTFVSGYTVTGPVTITGAYLPMAQVGYATGFTLTQTAETVDETDYDTAQGNSGHRVYSAGQKTVSVDLQGIFNTSNDFLALLAARSQLLVEINPDGSSLAVARGFFKPMNTSQSGDVGDLEKQSVTFNLSVPDLEKLKYPFHWSISTSSTLNDGIVECLSAWEDGTVIDAAYLADGTTGVQGNVVITDITLSGGLEVMNEFQITMQGSGKLEAYP